MNYLAINPKVSMFLTKDAYNIIIEKEDSNKRKIYDYFSVNKTGKLILESINGVEKFDTIIDIFIKNIILLKMIVNGLLNS
ncbi:hypothetical protein P3T75_10725 [Enterococcus montenegrensis]|uniref:hypothetical protein n=1 Tax=Enterococcus montenegrensis TaxID=3031993 RepID=UPI00249F196F|nr:hypothetical protein [Enterococcus montenegrensis]WHA08771.1 hypothetical protein P3T75_10725 [Enterococcus montenegrensis]